MLKHNAETERVAIAQFLRKYTHLAHLAKLIESGTHMLGEDMIKRYADANKLTLTSKGSR